MEDFNKRHLITRLKQGPLLISDWRTVAKSKESLKVRISNLRKEGFSIETIPLEPQTYTQGTPPGKYVLEGSGSG